MWGGFLIATDDDSDLLLLDTGNLVELDFVRGSRSSSLWVSYTLSRVILSVALIRVWRFRCIQL